MQINFIDLIGKRFDKLMVKKCMGKNKWRDFLWLCECDCGNEKIITGHNLKSGNTKSCGCLYMKGNNSNHFKHGHSRNGKRSKIYHIWQSMIQRCCNKNDKNYKDYGKRKIKVCYRWSNKNPNGFKNFLKDVGEIPRGLTLDRINNNKGYSPKNYKLSTMKEQARNKRSNVNITFNNKTQCLSAWAEEYKINPSTLWYRLYKFNWPIKKALTTRINHPREKNYV